MVIILILFGVVGLFLLCCFWVIIEEEFRRWKYGRKKVNNHTK